MTKLYVDDFPLTLSLEVDAVWHRFHRGAHEKGSGIPLEPDEPAHWEITSVWLGATKEDVGTNIIYFLSDDDLERLAEELSGSEPSLEKRLGRTEYEEER